jgi:curved DNA-binding protein CbpA
MEFKDYYKILGVERAADQKAIRQAFRKLARKYHPDVNPGDKQAEAKFKEMNEAYQVLNDPEKRAKYDQVLDLRQHGGGWEDLLRRGAGAGRGGDGTHTVYGSPENSSAIFSESCSAGSAVPRARPDAADRAEGSASRISSGARGPGRASLRARTSRARSRSRWRKPTTVPLAQ